MADLLWFNKKNFDDIFLIVNGAFVGWITDVMRACFISSPEEGILDIVIFFDKDPEKIDLKIINDEILFDINEGVHYFGYKEVKFRYLVLEDTIGKFKEEEFWLRQYWPIFQKYDSMPYDW